MSMNPLNDLSKVYLEQIAFDEAKKAKPDYLDFDGDGNKKEPMKKALKDKKNVEEAVKGEDAEMRRAAAAERQSERKERGGAAPKIPGREGPSAGKSYADYQKLSIISHDKKTKGKFIPGMVTNEALDPVGQEDADIDNDGKKNTKSDKYLSNRRKVRSNAITKESFSNWRKDLSEVMDTLENDDALDSQKQIKEKKIQNKIKINPDFKEAIENLGGQLLEMVEVDEALVYGGEKKEPEDKRMVVTNVDKKGNTPAWQKYKSGDKNYKAADHIGEAKVDKEVPDYERSGVRNKRYDNKTGAHALGGGIQRARRAEHEEKRGVKKEETELDEKAPPGGKFERMVKHIKSGYSKNGLTDKEKSIAYATAWKSYGKKKVSEAIATETPEPQQEKPNPALKAKQQQSVALQKQIELKKVQMLNKGIPLTQSYDPAAKLVDEQNSASADAIAKFNKRASEIAAKQKEEKKSSKKPSGMAGIGNYSMPGADKNKSYSN